MTRPIKIVVGLLGSLVVLVIVLCVIAVVSIDAIARKGIEAGATYALGVNTSLDKASVGIVSASFSMSGLKVDNPQGFDGKFMSLGKGGVAVTLGTLSGDTVVLPKLELSDLDLDLERGSKGANYQIIMDNLKRLDSGQKPKDTSGPGKKFKINEISITNVTVHLDLLGGPGGVSKVTVPIHEIKLTNVGNDGGVDLAKLTSIILQAVLNAAASSGGGLIPADVAGELKDGLKGLSGLSNVGVEAIGKVGETAAKLGGNVQKAVEDVGSQFKKLLGDKNPDAKTTDK